MGLDRTSPQAPLVALGVGVSWYYAGNVAQARRVIEGGLRLADGGQPIVRVAMLCCLSFVAEMRTVILPLSLSGLTVASMRSSVFAAKLVTQKDWPAGATEGAGAPLLGGAIRIGKPTVFPEDMSIRVSVPSSWWTWGTTSVAARRTWAGKAWLCS